MLAMGGMALGQAVDSSGLLLTISHKLQHAVERESPWAVLCIFCGLVLVATTFVSHTVGAIVILPILRAVGEAMPVRSYRVFFFIPPQHDYMPHKSTKRTLSPQQLTNSFDDFFLFSNFTTSNF